ncbi:hypothetical protein [Massilia sp. TWR1-2-2]|uniref:hypothetical protein n=1 Tax=Massilia sp. TWR1-2-2 TaxID=2804584 RepID=UPI003CFA6986
MVAFLFAGRTFPSSRSTWGEQWPPQESESADGRTIYYRTITEANKRAAASAEQSVERAGR